MATRRRPRLFSFSREIELSTIDGWAKPEERDLLSDVIDAFLEVTRTRQLNPARLGSIVEASVHSSANVRALGVSRLVVMAHYFEHAKSAFRQLAQSEDAGVRQTACAALANAPEDLLLSLLEIYFADAEFEVRRAAARIGGSHGAVGLILVLERALAKELDVFNQGLMSKALTYQAQYASNWEEI